MSNLLPAYTCYDTLTKKDKIPDFLTDPVPCPKCQQFGNYILRLNAYGPNRHFMGSCDQCSGWGWVSREDAKCIHKWRLSKNIGRCLNLYKCEKCGDTREVDSSD